MSRKYPAHMNCMKGKSMNIDQIINQRAAKMHPPIQEWTPSPAQQFISRMYMDSLSPIATATIPTYQEVKASCDRTDTQTKERNMRIDAQDKMHTRVNGVVHTMERQLAGEFHLHTDPNPKKVQGFLDAMAAGHIRLRSGVSPDERVSPYASLSEYFELRSVDADRPGYDAKVAELEFDATHVRDSILANPEPKDAYADFKTFLDKWEPKPGRKAS